MKSPNIITIPAATWYGASALYKGKHYNAFEMTRHASFMAVLRELVNAGAYPNIKMTV